MKERTYSQYLLCQNLEHLPNLPLSGANQALSDGELLGILLFGTSKSWQKERECQGFDPLENLVNNVVEFMEYIEATEDFNPETKPKAKTGSGKSTKKSSGNSNKKEYSLYIVCSTDMEVAQWMSARRCKAKPQAS